MTSTISTASSKVDLSVLYLGKDKPLEHKIRRYLGSRINLYLAAEDYETAIALYKQHAIDTIVADTAFA